MMTIKFILNKTPILLQPSLLLIFVGVSTLTNSFLCKSDTQVFENYFDKQKVKFIFTTNPK